MIRTKAYEPFDIYKKFTGREKDEWFVASEMISTKNKILAHRPSVLIRTNLFITDARIGWYFLFVKEISKVLSDERINAFVVMICLKVKKVLSGS